MNCEECNVDLMALAYGELEPRDAEDARARVGACPECQAELSRLEALRRLIGPWGAQQFTPPAATDDVILQAARTKVGAGAATATGTGTATAAVPEPGVWDRTVRWLAALAMGPQTAMATIMLLAIGIGLWYFPRTSEHDAEATGGTVTQIPEGTDVGASVQEASEPPSDWSASPALAESDAEEQAPPPLPAAPSPAEERDGRGGAVDAVPATAEAPTQGVRRERRARAQRPARRSRAAPAEAAVPLGAAERATTPYDRDDSVQARYQRGVQRQSQGDYRGAIDDFQEVLRAPAEADRAVVPDAIRRLADSYQRTGRCDGAVPQYESLLRRFPTYRQAGDVQVDLARCYTQLGRVSEARNTLQQAARHPAARRRAESALRRLDHGVAAEAAPAGAPASADTAASEAAY